MRFKYCIAVALYAALVAVPVLYNHTSQPAMAASTVEPAAQSSNTVVRWTRETQKNKMGDDIVMTLGYNHAGDTVVSILENKAPMITVTTYDADGNPVEVHSYDNGKQFVHSVYSYNEQGDQSSWVYQARTPTGVTETTCTYTYTYNEQGIAQKDTYQDGELLSRETYTHEQTDEGTVVRTITNGELSADLTCYDDDGRPRWRQKDTYRMVYYYDKLGRETENCVISNGMQQNRTVTVYGDSGYAIRRILYGANQQDVVSVSEIETLTTTPQLWLDFSSTQQTTAIVAPTSDS